MGLYDSKININVWCKSKFDKFDLFLLKLTSMLNLQSSIFNLQYQKLSQKNIFVEQFLFSLNKMILKALTKSRFAGNPIFDKLPQTRETTHFTQNMRFLTNFAGEGG